MLYSKHDSSCYTELVMLYTTRHVIHDSSCYTVNTTNHGIQQTRPDMLYSKHDSLCYTVNMTRHVIQ